MQPTPPPLSMSDGRMYRLFDDHVMRRKDGTILAMTRGQIVEISREGRIEITNKVSMKVEFRK
jgi:hypothetical protein